MERRSGNVCSLLQLHHLPIEAIDIILEHSSFKDMLNWGLTSKYWLNIVNRSSKFKNKVQLKITNNNCDDVMNYTRDYFNIRICHDASFGEENFKPVLEKLAPMIRRLTISADDMVQIHFPKLHELVTGGITTASLPENVKFLLTAHASQIKVLKLYYVNVENISQAMRMLPNLRALDFLPWLSTESIDAVSESILTLKMAQNIDCFSSVPNLKKLGVSILNYWIVKKCFQHLLKLEVVEYCCIVVPNTQRKKLTGFKRDLLSRYNFDFDKENKRNVKFVQKDIFLNLSHDLEFINNYPN